MVHEDMNSSILIFGTSGQLGWELQRSLSPLGLLTLHDRQSCDITNIKSLRSAIIAANPRVIINAGAYTSVDGAEKDGENTYKINSSAVGVIADMALSLNALFVHYSSDYVFDGIKSSPYVESDLANPLSIYGASKLYGERAIVDSGCDYLIFRTSWVFATRGSNFIKTVLRLAKERDSLRVVADQWGAPTSAELIADVTAHGIRDVLAQRAPGGLYHLSASGKTNWHEYANFILEQARQLGTELKTYSAEAISTAEYPLPAKRPLNSSLDTSKLQKTFQLSLPDWRYHVQRTIAELLTPK